MAASFRNREDRNVKSSGVSRRLAWLVCATLAGAPLFVGPMGTTAVFAQNAAHLSSQQLDSLTAPIALYPDALLAQVLMASTFPQDVQAAAAWSKSNPNLKGDDAVKAVASEPWDPSVQSLVAFPQVLATMDSKPEWVQQIGNAFLAQPNDVMDSVQRLRARAQEAGNLKSNEQQKVVVQPAPSGSATQTIVIEPANPQVVYVPTYNPTVVYGTWPYPAYPPVYMPPPPGYVFGSALMTGLAFGAGVAVANSLWGGFNWGSHDVNVNVNRYNNINVNNRINTNNATANWNRNANVERRQQNLNNANLNGQRNQYRGYDQSRTQAMQTLENRTGQNVGGNASQRLEDIQKGGNRPNANGANGPNGNRGNELNNRAQNGAQNANRGNELNNRAQNANRGNEMNNRAQNANRSNDLNNRAQNANRDNALRGAGDGANARLDQQRGQQSRQVAQSRGGVNGGGAAQARPNVGGGGHGGGFGGGGGGGGRHVGRR